MSYRASVRPSKTVASAVLSAALALAALPGLAGSRSLSPDQALDAAAFQAVTVPASPSRTAAEGGRLDAAFRGDGYIDGSSYFEEPGQARSVPTKAAVKVTASKSTW